MTTVRITRQIFDQARDVYDQQPCLAVAIPFVAAASWEPPDITEARIMWNAAQREPYWPEPSIVKVEFDASLFREPKP